jgi:hypothetical protein
MIFSGTKFAPRGNICGISSGQKMEKGYVQSGFTRNFGKEICDLPKNFPTMQGLCENFHKAV